MSERIEVKPEHVISSLRTQASDLMQKLAESDSFILQLQDIISEKNKEMEKMQNELLEKMDKEESAD